MTVDRNVQVLFGRVAIRQTVWENRQVPSRRRTSPLLAHVLELLMLTNYHSGKASVVPGKVQRDAVRRGVKFLRVSSDTWGHRARQSRIWPMSKPSSPSRRGRGRRRRLRDRLRS